MAKGPNDRDVPSSPDELQGGLRGRIGGVTRVGPRAFGIAFFVVCALLIAILYGVNKQSDKPKDEAFSSPPPAIETNEAHFGSNEPIVPTAPPPTPPPPLVLPPTSVPNLDNAADHTAAPAPAPPAAPAGPTAEDQRIAAQQAQERQAERDAEKKRQEIIDAAKRSPILTGTNVSGGNGSNPGAGGVQLSFAGNGDTGASGSSSGSGSAEGAGQGVNGSFASTPSSGVGAGGGSSQSGSGGNALVGRTVADNAGAAQAAPNAFLDGPTGQFRINSAQVELPAGASPKDFLQAQRFAPLSPFEILASSVIPATLITGIDSELPGLVSAQVREDVYDTKTGRYLLVPRGARLVGLYKPDNAFGSTRILVAWQRLIFPDTTSIDLLDMSGADVQGGAGFGGNVDNHYGKIYGAALLTSILAAGLQLAQPPQNAVNILAAPSAGQTVAQSVGQQLTSTATNIINKDLSIPPTIHVAKGYPFFVFVDRDIVLPGPYRAQ